MLGCTESLHEDDAALLLTSGGFQLYLIAKGDREPARSAGLGDQYLLWSAPDEAALEPLSWPWTRRVSEPPEPVLPALVLRAEVVDPAFGLLEDLVPQFLPVLALLLVLLAKLVVLVMVTAHERSLSL